jgi:two-component system, NarL family, invasion response regulator UvrY
VKILIADDHPIFRAGLKETLLRDSDVELVGEADNGQKVLALARRQRWDLVLLDITMPKKGGLEVLNELRREFPKLPILILSAHPEDQLALRLLKVGAAGYLTKDKAPEVLLSAIRKVLSGGKYVSAALAEKTVFDVISDAPQPVHQTLSNREYQVMSRIAAGKKFQDIAKELFISVRTVSTYRARIMDKMGMTTNAELIRYALEHKLID